MRYWFSAALLVALAAALLWLAASRAHAPRPAAPPSPTHRSGTLVAKRADTAPPRAASSGAASEAIEPSVIAEPGSAVPEPAAPGEASSSPESGPTPGAVLETLRGVFRNYSSRFGGNPVGTNPEITAALNGKNPGQAVFLKPEDGLRVNARGELVDNWNTPYFFHQLSRTEMEIHSAGPDRRMWTPDDLVIQ